MTQGQIFRQINAAAEAEGYEAVEPTSVTISETVAAPPFSIGDLINEEFLPREEGFEVVLSPRIALAFRRVRSYPELQRLKRAASEAAKSLHGARVKESLAPFKGFDAEAAAKAYLISATCTECRIYHFVAEADGDEEWRLERREEGMAFEDTLKVASQNPLVFETLLDAIDRHSVREPQMRLVEGAVAEGKG